MARLTNTGVRVGFRVSEGSIFAEKQRKGRFFSGFASCAPSPPDHPRQLLDTGQSFAPQTKLPDGNEFSNTLSVKSNRHPAEADYFLGRCANGDCKPWRFQFSTTV